MRKERRGNAWESVGCVGTRAGHTHSLSQITILYYRSSSDLSPQGSATETPADPLSVLHSAPGSNRPLLAETPSSQAKTHFQHHGQS